MNVSRSIRQFEPVASDGPLSGRRQSLRGIGICVSIVLVVLALATRSSANGTSSYGNTNPSVASPVRSATTPLSGYQSGLVSRPNPMDSSSNLVVTGNVGAGKHFRDTVPYRSTTSMVAPLGSTSLDSFMRYSAVPETRATATSPYSPFYSASGTAATMQPGTRSVFSGGASRVAPGAAQRPAGTTRDALYLDVVPRVALPDDADATADDNGLGAVPRLRLWPAPQGPEATRNGLPAGLAEPRASLRPTETLTGDDYHQQMEALQQRLGEVKAEVAQLEQSMAARDTLTQPAPDYSNLGSDDRSASAVPEVSRRERLLQETARLLAGTKGLPDRPHRQEDTPLLESKADAVFETRTNGEQRLQLYDPSRIQAPTSRIGSQPTVDTQQSSRVGLAPPKNTYGSGRVSGARPTPRTRVIPVPSAKSYQPGDQSASPARLAPETTVVQTSVQSPVKKVDTELSATALEEYARHLQLAERYLQKGAYPHAAKTYGLAIAYRPTDARAHLGRSHALLATGQYDASAAALARAIELDPQHVLTKTDLIGIIGGPDAFIARFNDLDETVEVREAPMLQLLLAYICHQMERPAEAKAAIEAAQRVLPTSAAIARLKAAIVR